MSKFIMWSIAYWYIPLIIMVVIAVPTYFYRGWFWPFFIVAFIYAFFTVVARALFFLFGAGPQG